MKQNITLSLDADLLIRAKVLAARSNTSVSRLLADELEAKISSTENYARARQAALALMETGLPLGGQPLDREVLHER